ncbi:MAG: co-chaperone GroES [bacterium]|nr:co-chaperone GroES [bacterium]
MAKKKISKSASKETGSKVSVRPLGDKVLVREDLRQGETKTASGIIIPESVDSDRGAKKGEVVAVGPGRFDDGKLVPMHVKIGDKVLFQWGDKLTIDGVEYEMVAESSILAVIK